MAARHSCKDNQETNLGTQATLDPLGLVTLSSFLILSPMVPLISGLYDIDEFN